MSIYTNFALLYDELMSNAPYDEWIRFTNHLIGKKNVNKIVDLGCGTGEITIRLAKQYQEVYGVDRSTAMLTIAQQKAFEKNVSHIIWIEQDIRKLSGFANIDLFISYCDVINYIVDVKDLQKLFQNIYHRLAEGGLFLFDVHSLEYVKHSLVDHTFTYKDEHVAYIWDCIAGEEEGEMYHDMTFFYRNDYTSTYERFDELHHQRTYDIATYEYLLKRANFKKIEFYSDFSIENSFSETNSERIFIVAEK